MLRMRWCLLLASCLSLAAAAADAPPFEPAQARAWFDEARQQCRADGGKLWGASLCGPIMFVEPSSRRVIANQADAQGVLKVEQGVFVGHLPDDVSFANSSLDWAGVRWAQMGWPLPADARSIAARSRRQSNGIWRRAESQSRRAAVLHAVAPPHRRR